MIFNFSCFYIWERKIEMFFCYHNNSFFKLFEVNCCTTKYSSKIQCWRKFFYCIFTILKSSSGVNRLGFTFSCDLSLKNYILSLQEIKCSNVSTELVYTTTVFLRCIKVSVVLEWNTLLIFKKFSLVHAMNV